jgi:hypothetical protein
MTMVFGLLSRMSAVLNQLRPGWYPDVSAPSFDRHGGHVPSISACECRGQISIILMWAATAGEGSAVETSLVAENAAKRVLVPTGDIAEARSEAW